jgi:hypothetical protein
MAQSTLRWLHDRTAHQLALDEQHVHDDPALVLERLEQQWGSLSPQMLDAMAPPGQLFAEPDDEETRLLVYTRVLGCLVEGYDRVPAELTADGCVWLKDGIVGTSLQECVDMDGEIMQAGIECAQVHEIELGCQLRAVAEGTHPFYRPETFLQESPKGGSPHQAWKLMEQQRLSTELARRRARPSFEGQLSLRVRTAAGLKPGHHFAVRVRLGQEERMTTTVKVDQHGVASWDETLTFLMSVAPSQLKTVQTTRKGRQRDLEDTVVVELLRTPGYGSTTSILVGSRKLHGGPTWQLWAPPPQWKVLQDVDVRCGWFVRDNRTVHSKRDTIAHVGLLAQYYFRQRDPEITFDPQDPSDLRCLESHRGPREDAHREWRLLCRRLHATLGPAGNGETLRCSAAVAWLLDAYAQAWGIGVAYRRIYEMRVLLARFEMSTAALVRLTISFDRLQREVAAGGHGSTTQHLTRAERHLYDECVLHLEGVLSRAFLALNVAFPGGGEGGGVDAGGVDAGAGRAAVAGVTELEAAVELWRRVSGLREQPPEQVLLELLYQGADQLVDQILSHQHVVSVPRVTTVMLVVRLQLDEYDMRFRYGLPDGLTSKVMHYYLQRAEHTLQITTQELALQWEAALPLYDAALALSDAAEHLLGSKWPTEEVLHSLFAPAFAAYVDNNETHLRQWAREAVAQENWEPLNASGGVHGVASSLEDVDDNACEDLHLGLHSSSVNDLVRFLLSGLSELESMASSPRMAKVAVAVMQEYCATLEQHCEASAVKRRETHHRRHHHVHSPVTSVVEELDSAAGLDSEAATSALELEFWSVRINNVWVLAEKRLAAFALDPSLLLPGLTSLTEQGFEMEVSEGVPGDATPMEKVTDILLDAKLSIRRVYRGLLAELVAVELVALDAALLTALQALVDLDCQTDAAADLVVNGLWDTVTASLDRLLAGVAPCLYHALFHRLLRVLCDGCFDWLHHGLLTNSLLQDSELLRQLTGPQLARLVQPGGHRLRSFFVAGGEGLSEAAVGSLERPMLALASLHQQPTATLVQQFRSLDEMVSADAQAGSIDQSTRNSISQKQADLLTVLRLRAGGHNLCEPSEHGGDAQRAARRQEIEAAQQLLQELGSKAVGSPPAELELPAPAAGCEHGPEQLVCTAKCRYWSSRPAEGLEGTFYVTTRWLCFQPSTEEVDVEKHRLRLELWAIGRASKGNLDPAGPGQHDSRSRSSSSKGGGVSNLRHSLHQKSPRYSAETELLVDGHHFGFGSLKLRDSVLAHLRRAAAALGATIAGAATRYELKFVTGSHSPSAALTPPATEISVTLVGTEASSEPHVLRQPRGVWLASDDDDQGAGLWAPELLVPRALGALQAVCLELRPAQSAARLFGMHDLRPHWELSELVVLNTANGKVWRLVPSEALGPHPLFVKVCPTTAAAAAADTAASRQQQPQQPQAVLTTVVETVFENQRRLPFGGFSSKALFKSDPAAWSDAVGRPRYKESVLLPATAPASESGGSSGVRWVWATSWEPEAGPSIDGWEYALHWSKKWEPEKSRTSLVRRRKWHRIRKSRLAKETKPR